MLSRRRSIAPSPLATAQAPATRSSHHAGPWSRVHAYLIRFGGQRLVEEARHHAHLPYVRISSLARLRVDFRLPNGDDDALARVGVRQNLETFEAPLLLQDRPKTPSDAGHLRFHFRREPNVRHPRVHERSPLTRPGNCSASFLGSRIRRFSDSSQVTSRSLPVCTS